MFQVQLGNTVYTAVVEIEGAWIDGNSGHDVTTGKFLGTYLGLRHYDKMQYRYYRNGNDVYQLAPNGSYTFLCSIDALWAFEKLWRK